MQPPQPQGRRSAREAGGAPGRLSQGARRPPAADRRAGSCAARPGFGRDAAPASAHQYLRTPIPSCGQVRGFGRGERRQAVDGGAAKGRGGVLVHAEQQLRGELRGRGDVPREEQGDPHELECGGIHPGIRGGRVRRGTLGHAPRPGIAQPGPPVLIVIEAQIEQCVGTVRGRGLLAGRQGRDPGRQVRGHDPPGRPPAAGPAAGQIEKTAIQIAHRLEQFERHLGSSRPASGVCILHEVASGWNGPSLKRGGCAFRRRMQRQTPAGSPWQVR